MKIVKNGFRTWLIPNFKRTYQQKTLKQFTNEDQNETGEMKMRSSCITQ